jgi:NADPH2:quinone reductase
VRAVVFSGPGGPEVVSVQSRDDPAPIGRQIVVAARYAGLNPADVAQRSGRYPAPPGSPPDIPGLEVAGTVVAVGPAVTHWRPGDRVFGIVGGGGLADRVVVDDDAVTAVPAALDEVVAAAVPEAFVTAHDAVFSQASLRLGDVLLVNGANGAVGTAAVQLGVAAGAHVIGAVRSEASVPALQALGAEVALDPAGVAAAAERRGGVDVVLELVGAPNLDTNLEVLARLGRIVIVGTGAGTEAPLALRKLMAKRGRIMGTGLRNRTPAEKATAVAAFADAVVPLLREGRVAPPIDAVFGAEDVIAAFEHLERPGKFGKVLLEFSGDV